MKKKHKYQRRLFFENKKGRKGYIYLFSTMIIIAFIMFISFSNSEKEVRQIKVANSIKRIPVENNLQQSNIKNTKVEEIECNFFKTKVGDNLSVLFERHRIKPSELKKLTSGTSGQEFSKIKPDQNICLVRNNEGKLTKMIYQPSERKTVIIKRGLEGEFSEEIKYHEFEKKLAFKSVKIKSFFYNDALHASISNKVIMNLAYLFGWDIDFSSDIRANDELSVLHEEEYIDGKYIGDGRILFAEFINNGKRHTAVFYKDKSGKDAYYTVKGDSIKKAFVRNPVKFTRISSHFNLKRKHPILHTIRAHRGVDFAAPSGTPVKASGDGKITFQGVKSGYGNTIVIQHGQKYSTLYAHLSKFAKKYKVGSKIKQGDVVAYVGMTGLATAPHLHYEFRINGVHKDPIKVQLPKAAPISKSELNDFKKIVAEYYEIIRQHKNIIEQGLDLDATE